MEYNVISRYVDFLKREYHNFFKIMFGDKYQKKLCEPFLDRYICVRYFNETSFTSDKDIISRLNKELVDVYDSVVDDDNEEMIKNIVALFGYIIYFDDVCQVIEEAVLINVLAEDEDITIEHDHNIKKDIKVWYINFKKKKEKFNNTIMTRDFDLIEERLYRKIYYLVLKHNVKISNLYSEFAIDKAYNSGLINEDKLFITLILSSLLVLNNAINMDFSRYYVVDMASSLFNKDKKLNRLFNAINNSLAKRNIAMRISYTDYLNNRDKINKLINDGYAFGVIIDDKFDGNLNELILFSYVFVDEENEYYDVLVSQKDKIKSKIIKI